MSVLDFTWRHFFGDFLCASKESYPPQAEALLFTSAKTLDPSFRRNDEQEQNKGHWIPVPRGDDEQNGNFVPSLPGDDE